MKRSKTDRIIGGVCGGIGEEFGIEPWVVRLLWILLSFGSCGFPGGLIYILAWILIPEE